MNIQDYFSIGSTGLIFGFLISVVVGVLGTIINSLMRFLNTY